MLEIDRKDREILFHLSLNARAGLTELAKKTRLSKEVIHYRLKNLEKKGVIEGYYAVINTYKMGKEFYRVYMKTINMDVGVEKKFIDFLQHHPQVTWVVEVDSGLDFLYVVWARNISEFEEVYNEINDRFGKYIEQKFFSVMTNVYYFKYKYLVGREDGTYKLTGGKIACPELDASDLKLIALLSNQGRLPLIEMAKKLKMPAKTIQRRMKQFTKDGIITCYTVKVNHKVLGYSQRKVMLNLNDTSSPSIRKLITFLTYHPLTIYITIAIGQYDLEFEMMEKNNDEFHFLLKELKNTFPELIKNYFTVVFYNEPKVGQFDFGTE
ncbi:MAG TPA: Lrp/AsnC family transcriptional regulator [Candidatus Nanoarchaeia archaeon]|nr:Lrp/AsnC family transcriptional regulator [Candidatus Nanoarchaeia archaeon]